MRIIYQIVSEKLKKIARTEIKKLYEMYDEANKFAKEVGAMPNKCYVSSGFGTKKVSAMAFKKTPDLKLWRKHNHCEGENAYYPTRRSKASKELERRINELKWSPTNLEKALKWKDIMHEDKYHTFSMGFNKDKDFFSFSVPALENKKKRYKPIEGLKEITYGFYEEKIDTK